jgi:hypothetical protein
LLTSIGPRQYWITFEGYLKSNNADGVAQELGLMRHKTNVIIPHRISVGIGDRNGIPGRTFSYEQCYYDCVVGDLRYTERFVEWGLKSDHRIAGRV